MSTKKITALTELAAAAAATDMIPIVDVSDTTDAATGTTKKITATNIGKGLGIGDGSTTAEPVKIDTATGNVGIGSSAPGYGLTVYEADASANKQILIGVGGAGDGDPYHTFLINGVISWSMGVDNSDSDKFKINSSGALGVTGGTAADRLTITTGGNVGIGATAPTNTLHVASSGFPTVMERFAGASTNASGIHFNKSRGGSVGSFTIVADGDGLGSLSFQGADGDSWVPSSRITGSVDGTPGDGDMPGRLEFLTTADGASGVTERMRIDSTGNMLLGGTATPASSVGNLCLFNGTAPSGSVTNGVVLYAQDVSTSELKVRDEAGNVSTLSPHNFELLGERSEPMAWSYANKNVFVGKEVNVDMMKVIRALEKLTGEEYIKIKDIAKSEKLDWDEEEKRKEAEQKKEIDAYKKRKAENAAHPTSSSTKAEIKAYLDKSETEYEDAAKEELFKLVPEKEEFTEVEPAAYSKKAKPDWIK